MSSFNGQAPVKVSPLIRASRWALLLSGIVYGAMKQRHLAEREGPIREEEERQRKIQAAKIAEERRIASDRDIKMLESIFLEKHE